MKAKVILTILAAVTLCWQVKAQFYSYGYDKGSLKWSQIETPTYRVVYPRGLDSLARVYALNLEKVAGPVGSSIGYRPNEAFRKKMPVILHPFSTDANGMVSLIPYRMELMTNPDPYSPDVLPWIPTLAIHESRHVSQLQFARTHGFKALYVLMGELGAGALTALYCGPNFFEGDAVLAETALTDAGRGRSADFLEYMRVSFAAGDWRDYWKWRYGSQNRYTPDHYRVGYITMAGVRTLYDAPHFTKDYFDRIFAHGGIAFFNFQKTVRDISGLRFKDAFRQIEESLDSTWGEERASRAPFIPSDRVSEGGRLFTEYLNLEYYGNSVLAVRKGISETASLVRVWPDGSEEKIHSFSSLTSRLNLSLYDSKVWWTEYHRDPRWSLVSTSDLKYLNPDGKIKTLVKGRRLFNPSASGNGLIAVVEYLPEGYEKVVTLNADTGAEEGAWRVPDGLQAVETAWIGNSLYISGLNEEGFGVYRLPDFECMLKPSKKKIKHFGSNDGKLVFTSDLNGVDEIYSYDPDSEDLRQLTSTPDGAGDFVFSADTLYYTMLTRDGRNIYRTAISDLQDKHANVSAVHRYPMAEKLSEHETGSIPDSSGTQISSPANYSKFGHSVKVHSWVPIYFNCDDISSLSYETLYNAAGIGATAFFQNELSTVSGLAGIHVDHRSGWRPSAHLKLTYRGLYPVLELQTDFNDRLAGYTEYSRDSEEKINVETTYIQGRPKLFGSLRAYVPLVFSSCGWNSGLVPQLKFTASNDRIGYYEGNKRLSTIHSSLSVSVRGYTMKGVPKSGMFPRLGIGAEAGYSVRPDFSDVFCSNAYGYLYGYIPGFMDTHGIKLTAGIQGHVSKGILCESFMRTVPRGFSTASQTHISSYPLQTKFTIDYALPFAPVDWSWMSPVAYIRNFELTIHGDYGYYRASSSSASLFSAGADLAAHLGNLLWIPYGTRIGVSYNYLGGNENSHSVGLLFSVAM